VRSDAFGGRKRAVFAAAATDRPASLLSLGRRYNVAPLIPPYPRPGCCVGGAFPKRQFITLSLVPLSLSDSVPRTRSRTWVDLSLNRIRLLPSHLQNYKRSTCNIPGVTAKAVPLLHSPQYSKPCLLHFSSADPRVYISHQSIEVNPSA